MLDNATPGAEGEGDSEVAVSVGDADSGSGGLRPMGVLATSADKEGGAGMPGLVGDEDCTETSGNVDSVVPDYNYKTRDRGVEKP